MNVSLAAIRLRSALTRFRMLPGPGVGGEVDDGTLLAFDVEKALAELDAAADGDASGERRAWETFAAAGLVATDGNRLAADVARLADEMLEQWRARFAPEGTVAR